MGHQSRRVAIVVGAALVLSGCSVAQGTPVASTPTVLPAPSAPATSARAVTSTPPEVLATAEPSRPPAEVAAIERAVGVIVSLGGSADPDASTTVSDSGLLGEPGELVSVSGWRVQWDPQGRLIFVAILPPFATSSPGTVISEAVARNRLADFRTRLGLVVAPPNSLVQDPTTEGWLAQWDRLIGGVPVSNDGMLMAIGADGAFLSYRYVESETAPAPAKTLSKAKALSLFPRCRNSTGGPNGLIETCTATLEWHAPQMTTGAPLQLCWRIDYLRRDNDGTSAGVLWLDAGTGQQVDAAATM
jgi:hypothetical protein